MSQTHEWIHLLDDEDRAFLKRFVLASGSLKDLAAAYSISYPTVRLRLDRLIAKIEIFDSQRPMDDFERTVRAGQIGRDLWRRWVYILFVLRELAFRFPASLFDTVNK